MLKNLAIWYLRKKKVSVIIGYFVHEGILQSLNNSSHMYDCTIDSTQLLDRDCNAHGVPEGKFQIVNGVRVG